MNENGGLWWSEDCKEQNLYCEDCLMYEYDKYRLIIRRNLWVNH